MFNILYIINNGIDIYKIRTIKSLLLAGHNVTIKQIKDIDPSGYEISNIIRDKSGKVIGFKL